MFRIPFVIVPNLVAELGKITDLGNQDFPTSAILKIKIKSLKPYDLDNQDYTLL